MDIADVTMIIPVYNSDKYLRECLDSVINQTYKNIEIICIDDGSTDNSLKILQEYAEKDSRIVLIKQKNFGVSKTRNLGISIAKGKYIKFLDSDDKIELYTIEKMLKVATDNNADLVISSYNLINKKGKKRNLNIRSEYIVKDNIKQIKKEKAFEYLYDLGIGISVCNKLYKKEILINNNIKFNENMSYDEDMFFNWLYITKVNSIHIVNDDLYLYRLSYNSATMKFHDKLFEKYMNELKKISKAMQDEGCNLEYIKYVVNRIYMDKLNVIIFMIIKSNKSKKEKQEELAFVLENSDVKEADLHATNILSKIYVKGIKNKNTSMLIVWAKLLSLKRIIARILK